MRDRRARFRLLVRGSGVPSAAELISGVHFNLGEARLAESLYLPLRPLECDLVRLAMGIYATDRLIRKKPAEDERAAYRELELVIQSGTPDFWNSKADLIRRILNFLSEDSWHVSFTRGPHSLSLPPFLLDPPVECSSVCAYSGGLDSCAGLGIQLGKRHENIFAVTALHQPHQKCRVVNHHQRMMRHLGPKLASVMSKTTLIRPPRLDQQELSQRCRSFLFCAIAGAVASRVRAQNVWLLENGVGVLNLPLMTGMLWGGRTTRGCHPHFLRMMSELITAVAERPITFSLPFRRSTKAEMVAQLAGLGLCELIEQTVSCVHYPVRKKGSAKQCGLCPGCLGHRQAVLAADLNVDAGFEVDILDPQCDKLPPEALGFLRAQVLQVADLHELTSDGTKPKILAQHLTGSAAATLADPAEDWVRLLGRL